MGLKDSLQSRKVAAQRLVLSTALAKVQVARHLTIVPPLPAEGARDAVLVLRCHKTVLVLDPEDSGTDMGAGLAPRRALSSSSLSSAGRPGAAGWARAISSATAASVAAESGKTAGGRAHVRFPRRRRASGSVFSYQVLTVSWLGPG